MALTRENGVKRLCWTAAGRVRDFYRGIKCLTSFIVVGRQFIEN
jgi:hypothetical protein